MASRKALRDEWLARWEPALACWSRHTRLSLPRLCLSEEDAQREGLHGSFAMIRYVDHAIVVSLPEVEKRGVGRFALEILAHEVGHHVLFPQNLHDHGRAMARVRRGLPTREHLAPFVQNLWADLLVNDRLARDHGLDLAGVYRALGTGPKGPLWTFYLRIYERLFGLPPQTLTPSDGSDRLEGDAALGARLVRAYAQDGVRGAGRFAALAFPYLLEDEAGAGRGALAPLLDTGSYGEGADSPDLASIDADEEDDVIHPAEDPLLGGAPGEPRKPPGKGGKRSRDTYRGPLEYGELLQALGQALSPEEATMRYYRERARPHVIPIPSRLAPVNEPLPEGFAPWEIGDPVESIDWLASLLRSPHPIPGLTTVERTYGEGPGGERKLAPFDLYIGIDCSGSMPNPERQASAPVLAGVALTLSALRSGARVRVVLSGEPGRSITTKGYVSRPEEALSILTSYLGTGYAFGVHRLAEALSGRRPEERPVHLVVMTDFDVFSLLDKDDGWGVAARALTDAKGGGTFVLRAPPGAEHPGIPRLGELGYGVVRVYEEEDLPRFARELGRRLYERAAR
jgi:hypothetical protein